MSGPAISQRLAVPDASAIGAARRAVMDFATRAGFDVEQRAEAGIVASEAASNLVKHARSGEILVRVLPAILPRRETDGIEILALDRGPGVRDAALARTDGWSSVGTLGGGLGAITRLSRRSDLYSRPSEGLALLAQLWPSGTRAPDGTNARVGSEVGAVSLPAAGETVCGDAWVVDRSRSRARVLVADGIGHGPDAHTAAQLALATLSMRPDATPATSLGLLHAALRPTRGAAALLVDVDFGRGFVTACGVGNVAARVVTREGSRHLVSHNGTLGHGSPRFQEFTSAWPPGALLVVHSDGLGSRWDLAAYPGLVAHHPGLVAGVLYRDFARGRDDVTVVALKGSVA